MDSVGDVPDKNKRKQCTEFHKDYKRTCRLNRMIIKTTSSCFMVMWGSNDDVDLVVDAAAHKTALPKDFITLKWNNITLDNKRKISSYKLEHDSSVMLEIKPACRQDAGGSKALPLSE